MVVDWLCEEDIDRCILAVATDDPPIEAGAVLFGSFGDSKKDQSFVVSKKEIALRRSSTLEVV